MSPPSSSAVPRLVDAPSPRWVPGQLQQVCPSPQPPAAPTGRFTGPRGPLPPSPTRVHRRGSEQHPGEGSESRPRAPEETWAHLGSWQSVRALVPVQSSASLQKRCLVLILSLKYKGVTAVHCIHQNQPSLGFSRQEHWRL